MKTEAKPDNETKPEKRAITAIDALAKIQKLLAQLSDEDRKRVIHFLNQ